MTLRIYNTLTRSKEEFKSLEAGKVGMYACGPTVYSYAHIGNMRTYLFEDVLRRVLQYDGYDVTHIMNITDVGHLVSDADEGEDKMITAMRREGKSAYDIAQFYTAFFLQEMERLNCLMPTTMPPATAHIPEMITLIQRLDERGHSYVIEDGVYYDVSTFPDYGKLSRLSLEGQEAGARVEVNDEKRNPADFALWKKAAANHLMQWPSPWGQGYPGWHIECSAMSMEYLGETFDIHTGGVDHIPIHHENEIAQSEGATGKKFVNYWVHGEFLLMDGGKMSKSLGNLYTTDDLMKNGVDPLAYRYFSFTAHYRTKLNFTWDAVKAQQKAFNKLREFVANAAALASEGGELGDTAWLDGYRQQFQDAIDDDLNMPRAVGVVWNMVNDSLKRGKAAQVAARELLLDIDRVLGLRLADLQPMLKQIEALNTALDELPAEVASLIEERNAAKAGKDFKRADQIRDQVRTLGYELVDRPGGVVEWRKVDE
ncbi:MAG: cysteine--tRNA ligase [Candidatus Chloroheliales bacterium]|nr:MAG: cysteine--tRNA ligase [Chloroflexota bacterium]